MFSTKLPSYENFIISLEKLFNKEIIFILVALSYVFYTNARNFLFSTKS